MKINAGPSGVGAEMVPHTFYQTIQAKTNAKTNALPHTTPKVAMTWALPPVEAARFGKSSTYICNQLKDPKRNGDRTIWEVASHLDHDLVLRWA